MSRKVRLNYLEILKREKAMVHVSGNYPMGKMIRVTFLKVLS